MLHAARDVLLDINFFFPAGGEHEGTQVVGDHGRAENVW
jgi:hypothetical protein